MPEPYAELHAYSCFSFRRGASTVEDLMERAWELGLTGLAITDRDGLYGSVRQWLHHRRLREVADERRAAGQHAVPRPVYGAELCLDDGGRVVALVENRAGWRNLSALITESRMGGEKGVAFLPFERLVARREGLFLLSGGSSGPGDPALLGPDGRPARQDRNTKAQRRGSLGATDEDTSEHHIQDVNSPLLVDLK